MFIYDGETLSSRFFVRSLVSTIGVILVSSYCLDVQQQKLVKNENIFERVIYFIMNILICLVKFNDIINLVKIYSSLHYDFPSVFDWQISPM